MDKFVDAIVKRTQNFNAITSLQLLYKAEVKVSGSRMYVQRHLDSTSTDLSYYTYVLV